MTDVEVMEIEPAALSKAPAEKAAKAGIASDSRKDGESGNSLMWVEKFRPRGLDDLISHGHIITTLRHLIASNRMPHLLFHGPPGTGKTSTILACAREMYGASFRSMVLELNASDDRGIGVVRDQIKSFASTRRIFSSGVKLIILDEADAMTSAAQAALRRVVEKYVANTRFCLICNYVNKITPALQSRCTKFRFGPLPPEEIRSRLEFVIKQEQVSITPAGIDTVLRLARGDMRRVLNILQSTHMAVSPGEISSDSLYSNTGDPRPADIKDLFTTLLDAKSEFVDCTDKIKVLKAERGVALGDLVEGLTGLVTNATKEQLSADAKIYLYRHLADCEHRLALGASESVNTVALVGAFCFAVAMTS